MYMAYRKRSLDLPGSEDSSASIKHPRSSTGSSTRTPLSISTALEPAQANSSGEYIGGGGGSGSGSLPPIRSLTTGSGLTSPGIPSFRHFHTASSFSNSPVSSHVRQQQQQQHYHQAEMPVQSGLTASLSQLSHTRTQLHPQISQHQHPQSAVYPGHHYSQPPSVHYTYAPPQPPPPAPPPPPLPPQAYRHGSSPISSTQSAGSPHMARRGLDPGHVGGGGGGGEGAAGHLEMMDGGSIGSPREAVKVARNWSRDETLSLVRAIKRHYEALKRCKTNQERSNVWHRIHKEHSSQFPGRSKKASQDRWGKVLSDYKDVMVHNKEKGAARWTFDFFKEVAGIIEGDAQYLDSALSPPSSSATTTVSAAGGRPADDLSTYSFGAASSSVKSHVAGPAMAETGLSNAIAVPRMAHHRMSEPNLALHSAPKSDPQLRFVPQVRPPPPPPPPSHGRHGGTIAMHVPQYIQHQSQQLSPVEGGQSSALDGRQSARYSPPRRTSYPQLQYQQQQRILQSQQLLAQANVASRMGRGSYHTFRYYPQLSASGNGAAPPAAQRIHSWAPPSTAPPGVPEVRAAAESPDLPILVTGESPELTPLLTHSGDPDETCQQVLDILARQMRRIDAEQKNLTKLKESTQNTLNRVEQIMQMYIRPPPPPPASDDSR
ncbi:hypothetical protein GGF42_006100 [Coemansia sp. RSA 2424]|nr:hypothetical protein GGF42_006100 [Coemansia sp. RSA 2424]